MTANTSSFGAAISSARASPKIINTIIFDNVGTKTAPAAGYPQIQVSSSTSAGPTISYSAIQNSLASGSSTTIDPRFGIDGGGNKFVNPKFQVSPTLGSPTTPFNLILKSGKGAKGSKLINNGDDSVSVGTVDILGSMRRSNGKGTATTGKIDIGAYETQ